MGNKYRNIPCIVEGKRFSSKKEGKRYSALLLLLKHGVIQNLTLQPRFPILINGKKICDYVGDFQYFDIEKDKWTVEDVKGIKTPVYKLKKKMLYAYTGIVITEI